MWSTACACSGSTSPMCARTAGCAPATWGEAFAAIAAKVKAASPARIGAIAGDLAAVEEMFALKDLIGAARLEEPRLPAGRRGARSGGGAGDLSVQPDHRRHRRGRRLLIVGSNPRREAAVLNARIRKRWRAAPLADRPDRRARRSDLSLRLSRRRRRTRSPISPPAAATSPRSLKDAKAPLIIVGQGALARPRRRGDRRARRQGGGRARRGQGRLERLLRAAHRGRRASAGSTSASCRARAGSKAAEMATVGHARRPLPARRRRDRRRAGRLRRLYRHPRRPRRASRRRDPAGRRLYGKIGPLRQHRGPGADGGARDLPAGRRARGLGDPARAVRRARPQAALRLARRSCARRCSRRIRICSASTRSRPAMPADVGKLAGGRRQRPTRRAFAQRRRRFLSHQSDRARLGGDGRMLGARRGAAGASAAE